MPVTMPRFPPTLPRMAAMDWTDEQNDAIVANYFAMLAEDLAGRPYNKAAHNRAVQDRIDPECDLGRTPLPSAAHSHRGDQLSHASNPDQDCP